MGNIEKEEVSSSSSQEVKEEVYSSSGDAMNFRVVPSCQYGLRGVVNKMQVLFQIKTGTPLSMMSKERPPLSIAVVLDRSGSMAGDKIEKSKEAIKQMIYQLTEKDQLHLIVYDSKVDVVFENGDLSEKASLESRVRSIKTRGCTNMGDALDMAANILMKNKKETIDMKRIFLFSDGLVNEGKYRTASQIFGLVDDIKSRGIQVTTFGIGDDFDEKLMKGIADRCHSNYFYIEDSSMIELYVSKVFDSALGSIGTNAKLTVRGINGGVVTKIYSENSDAMISGAPIGDIKPNNTKSVLIEADYTPKQGEEEEEFLQYLLSFKHCESKEEIKIQGNLKIKNTDNADLVSVKNPETETALTIQKAADIDEEVLRLLEQKKVDEALKVNQRQLDLLQSQVASDRTGRAGNLLKKANQQQEQMKKKTEIKKMAKMAHYNAHLKRHDSSDWMGM